MENWEKKVNLPAGITGEELNDKLKTVHNYIGIIKISDLDKITFNDMPVTFVIHYNNHWIAIYLDRKNLEIMDSTHTVLETMPLQFINFIYNNQHKSIRVNPILQSTRTNVCGLYCVYFVISKSKNMNFSSIVSTFTDDVRLNDYIVGQLTG